MVPSKIISSVHVGELAVENIDVFCEEGVFSIDQTRQIVTGGQNIGLAANFHGDELHPTSSAEVRNYVVLACE